jgi:hypothetical protein
MRVQVYIPGTVESYCIDERGDKRIATDELWLETYLCSVLRAYSYADDGSGDTIKKIVGVRRFNPITSTESEHKFLDAAERLFFSGWYTSALHMSLSNMPQAGNWGLTQRSKYRTSSPTISRPAYSATSRPRVGMPPVSTSSKSYGPAIPRSPPYLRVYTLRQTRKSRQ